MIILRLLLLIVLSPFVLLARILGLRGSSNIVDLREDHPEMAKAIADARGSLPEFVRMLATPGQGMTQFAVKVRFAVSHGHEHCWVSDLELRDSSIVGRLGNEPRGRTDLRLGSEVVVNEGDITDWSYVDAGGVHRGHFTTRVLMQHLPKRVRRDAERVFGWSNAA